MRFAAFGDSLMWGQGLRRADRFSNLTAIALARDDGVGPAFTIDNSRSGACIRPHGFDRTDFPDTYLSLFVSPAERTAFIAGANESPATDLYGEIPATFRRFADRLTCFRIP
jgi:hypothetical protein